MTTMTTQDRHELEGLEAAAFHGRCHHGRPLGYSNYDVAFCGACEREDAEEAAHFDYCDELDATGVHPFPIGPVRGDADIMVKAGFRTRDEVTRTANDNLPF